MNLTPEFSFLVDCKKLQGIGKTIQIEASTVELEAIANRFELLSLDSLKLDALVSRKSAKVIHLVCNFKAEYRQKCIVTLKPLKKEIDCSFQRIYSPSEVDCFKHESEPQEINVENSRDFQEQPDPLINGFFDLGESVTEQLSLEIDPFPRSAGVKFNEFSCYQSKQNSEQNINPFSILEQLKKKL